MKTKMTLLFIFALGGLTLAATLDAKININTVGASLVGTQSRLYARVILGESVVSESIGKGNLTARFGYLSLFELGSFTLVTNPLLQTTELRNKGM